MNKQLITKNSEGGGWKIPLTVFTLAHTVGTVHSTAVTVMVPVIKNFYDIPYTAVAFLITCYSIGQTLSSIPNGGMIDRIGVRSGLLVAHGVLLAAALLLFCADIIWLAYLALFLMGWGYSAINPATAKGVYQTFNRTRRATAMGIKQTGVPLGGVVAGLLGGIAVSHHDQAAGWNLQWQTIMLIVSAATVAGAFLCLLLPKSLSQFVLPPAVRTISKGQRAVPRTLEGPRAGFPAPSKPLDILVDERNHPRDVTPPRESSSWCGGNPKSGAPYSHEKLASFCRPS